jgi:hypothetical protein
VGLLNNVSAIVTGIIPKTEPLLARPLYVAFILLAVAARLLTNHRLIIIQQ